MDKLFEMYVRAYLKKAGIGSYDSKEPGIKLSQYDDKTAVLRGRTKDYSKYIAGNIKPDIIIYNDEIIEKWKRQTLRMTITLFLM